ALRLGPCSNSRGKHPRCFLQFGHAATEVQSCLLYQDRGITNLDLVIDRRSRPWSAVKTAASPADCRHVYALRATDLASSRSARRLSSSRWSSSVTPSP